MERRPKVLFDLDDTLFNTSKYIIDYLKHYYDYDINFEDITVCNLEVTHPHIPIELVHEAVYSAITTTELEPFKNAVETVNYVAERNSTYILSYRDLDLTYITKDLLVRNGINIDKINVLHTKNKSNGIPDKAKFVAINDIDIVCEDNTNIIFDLYDRTICSRIFIFDRPWNRFIEDNDRIVRIKSWEY